MLYALGYYERALNITVNVVINQLVSLIVFVDLIKHSQREVTVLIHLFLLSFIGSTE